MERWSSSWFLRILHVEEKQSRNMIKPRHGLETEAWQGLQGSRHYIIPETGKFTQQTPVSRSSGGWKSKVRGQARWVLVRAPILVMSSHGLPWCMHTQRSLVSFSSYYSINFIISVALLWPNWTLITSQRPHFPVRSHLGMRASTWISWGHKHSVHHRAYYCCRCCCCCFVIILPAIA